MIPVQCEQGTQEWHDARAGAITASRVAEIRDRYKVPKERAGQFKDPMRDYAFRLAIERISGRSLDESGFDTWQARRGRELEEEARNLHQLLIGKKIKQTGIVLTDDRKFGASADGLIGDDGGAEYKCFLAPEKLRKVLIEDDISGVYDQVQTGLWITGRSWWDFVLYCPALAAVDKEISIHTIWRDDDYIEAMEMDLVEFDRLVIDYQEKLGGSIEYPEPEEETIDTPPPDAGLSAVAGCFGG